MASNLIDAISGAERPDSGKNPDAVALGRLGGLKGAPQIGLPGSRMDTRAFQAAHVQ
jgi:hypothetical protein